MTQHIRIAVSFLAACSTAVVLSAQTPSQPQTPPRPQTPTQPSTRGDTPTTATTTIVGCLKAEKDIPGLAPNVAERAGVGEDYILTNARVGSSSGSSSGSSAGTTGSGSAAGSGSGTGSGSGAGMGAGRGSGLMYKITGLDRDELKKHLNHQVELQGRVDDSSASSATRTGATATPDTTGTGSGTARGSSGPDMKPKEFEATALKMVSATCPGSTH